jgi:hypothetical protein
MRYLLCVLSLVCLQGCSSLGLTNEDAGHSILAGDVTIPANGAVVYTISRNPRLDPAAQQYNRDMSVSRSFFGWFKRDAGKARAHVGGVK